MRTILSEENHLDDRAVEAKDRVDELDGDRVRAVQDARVQDSAGAAGEARHANATHHVLRNGIEGEVSSSRGSGTGNRKGRESIYTGAGAIAEEALSPSSVR